METLAQVHLASQYLAMAAKSFLELKDDDSHTNVGFFNSDNTLRTWDLDEFGSYLAFSFNDFTLRWNSEKGEVSFKLDGNTHSQIVTWITQMSTKANLNNPYKYDLHYELPYSIRNDFVFKLTNKSNLEELLQLRIQAQKVLRKFLNSKKLVSDIRIWPHHFDTGAFVVLDDGSRKSIGLGMAIPDSVVDDHYFYMSGYKDHKAIAPHNFPKLSYGLWKHERFKGAVIPASKYPKEVVINFYNEAYEAFSR